MKGTIVLIWQFSRNLMNFNRPSFVTTGNNVLYLTKVGKDSKMLTLHVIRHAKTLQEVVSGQDKDRELMEKGVAQSNLLGNYIQSHHIELGKILCSSAVRTMQTKSIVCQHLAERCDVDYRDNLYLASKETILKELSLEEEKTITLIGHNEGISDLISYCSNEFIQMKTAEFITITFSVEQWTEITNDFGTILLRYRPEVFLPKVFAAC